MKNGFTLIELLAVIVVLAIIALIAVPVVLNIINDAKESSLLRSAEFYLDAVEYTIADAFLYHGGLSNGVYPITEDGHICKTSLPCDDLNTLKVEVSGDKPTSGIIVIKEGTISDVVIKLGENSITKNDSNEFVLYNAAPADCFFYEDNSDGSQTITLTDYHCDYEDLVIPKAIDGKIVTKIGYFGFQSINSVVIPNSVIELENSAFEYCGLTSVIIPSSVKIIGEYTFSGNSLTNITIPNGVEKIGDNAFEYNSFESIIIPESVNYIGDSTFLTNPMKNIKSVTIKGKSSKSDFEYFGTSVFDWADGYSNANIVWEGAGESTPQILCTAIAPIPQPIWSDADRCFVDKAVGVQATEDAPYAAGTVYSCDLGDGAKPFYVLREDGDNVKLIANDSYYDTREVWPKLYEVGGRADVPSNDDIRPSEYQEWIVINLENSSTSGYYTSTTRQSDEGVMTGAIYSSGGIAELPTDIYDPFSGTTRPMIIVPKINMSL